MTDTGLLIPANSVDEKKFVEIKFNPDQLLTTDHLAVWLDCSRHLINRMRLKGGGPPFIRFAPNMVRYRCGDVVEWIRSKRTDE